MPKMAATSAGRYRLSRYGVDAMTAAAAVHRDELLFLQGCHRRGASYQPYCAAAAAAAAAVQLPQLGAPSPSSAVTNFCWPPAGSDLYAHLAASTGHSPSAANHWPASYTCF
jgi:hypothetical protein